MRRSSALLLCFCAALALSACTSGEDADSSSAVSSTATTGGDAPLAKVPLLPGYKYYVGGPTMGVDDYGRYRVVTFNGEVEQPPSRGMIFGAKTDGDKMEYRMWGNGVPLGFQRGVMKDERFWPEYVEKFRMGKLVVRQVITYDEAAKRYKVSAEDIDPENGETIRTVEFSESYYPPTPSPEDAMDEDDWEDSPTAPDAGTAE